MRLFVIRHGRPSRVSAVLVLLSAAILLHLLPSAVCAASTARVDYDEEDFWWDTQERTELWTYIESRRWSKAAARVRSHPDEASILVLRRERTGKIYEKSLPLHKVFEVDVVEDARPFDDPPPNGGEVPPMPADQVELIELLLSKHPDAAKVSDSEGRLPLHLAAYSSVSAPPSTMSKLIDAYAGALGRTDEAKKLPLHAACSAPLSSYGLVRAVADAMPESVRRTDKDGALPIHLASWAGGRRGADAARTFEFLHGAYPESVRVRDEDGDTALMIMIKYGRTSPDALDFLLRVDPEGPAAEVPERSTKTDEKENSNVTTGESSSGEKDGELKDADELSDGVDVGEDAGAGAKVAKETVLHGALAGPGHDGTADMLERILAVQPDLARARDGKGKLPIHVLLDHCCASLDAVSVLSESYGDGIKVADDSGRLPLHHACRESVDDPDIVRYLLERYPEAAGIPDGAGALPLHLAVGAPSGRSDYADENGDSSMDVVVSILADRHPDAAGVPDPRTGALPLHAALRRHKSSRAIERLVKAHPESARTAGNEGGGSGSKSTKASASASSGGATALHILAEEREEYHPRAVADILVALVTSNVGGTSVPDADGRLPLHAACLPGKDVPPRRRREIEREAKREGWERTPQEVLVGGLLESDPGAAEIKDGEGNLPLHYACRSHGRKVVDALLDAYPDGASVVSDASGLVPLQIACGALRPKYEQYEKGKDVDAIVGRLVKIHPDGARASGGKKDEGGGGDGHSTKEWGLPLHIISASLALSPHLTNETVLALIAANPDAVRTRDSEGNLPLHNAIRNRPHDTAKSTVLIRSLLREYPAAALEHDFRDNLPLHIALTHARGGSATGSTYRRISKLLFDANPDAVLKPDSAGRLPVHRVAKILGETGGVGKDMPGWAALLREIVERNPPALVEKDDRGRTPLHCLCFSLSDAVSDLAEAGKSPKSSSDTMEGVFRFLLAEGPDALDVEDGGGKRPRDMVENDRRLGHLGEDRGELSPTFTALKREVMKGSKHWKTIGAAEPEEEIKKEPSIASETGSDEL